MLLSLLLVSPAHGHVLAQPKLLRVFVKWHIVHLVDDFHACTIEFRPQKGREMLARHDAHLHDRQPSHNYLVSDGLAFQAPQTRRAKSK